MQKLYEKHIISNHYICIMHVKLCPLVSCIIVNTHLISDSCFFLDDMGMGRRGSNFALFAVEALVYDSKLRINRKWINVIGDATKWFAAERQQL